MKVVIVGATHGNERTGYFLIRKWMSGFGDLPSSHEYLFLIGNPMAAKNNLRFIDYDLNRAFGPMSHLAFGHEKIRAQEIYNEILKFSNNEKFFLLDLHTTTSQMRNTFVLSKSDPLSAWVAKASQQVTQESYILFNQEIDNKSYFLDSLAPHGLILEVGPVAQGVEKFNIIKSTELAVLNILQALENVPQNGSFEVNGFGEYESVEYPLNSVIHSQFQNKDYKKLNYGTPVFTVINGDEIFYTDEDCYPIFIGEAAYVRSQIAFIKTQKKSMTYSF